MYIFVWLCHWTAASTLVYTSSIRNIFTFGVRVLDMNTLRFRPVALKRERNLKRCGVNVCVMNVKSAKNRDCLCLWASQYNRLRTCEQLSVLSTYTVSTIVRRREESSSSLLYYTRFTNILHAKWEIMIEEKWRKRKWKIKHPHTESIFPFYIFSLCCFQMT